MSGLIVGLDIGGTKTEALVIDPLSSTRGRAIQSTSIHSPEEIVNGIVLTVNHAILDAGIVNRPIQCVGVGIPGRIIPETGEVQLAVNLGLEAYPLGKVLSGRFGAPVYLENDVRLAAVGAFQYFRQHQPLRSLAFIGIGTGVSAGIILDGKLHRGSNGMAGEIGHVVIEESGALCNCGLRGCLETVIAGPAIARQASEAGLDGNAVTTARELYHLAEAGDMAAQNVVERISSATVRAIQWIVMTYDVEKVVLGGGVTSAGTTFLDTVSGQLAKLRSQSELARVMLPDSKLALLPEDFNAGANGAIRMAQEALGLSAMFPE